MLPQSFSRHRAMQRSFRKLDRDDFNRRIRGINRRTYGVLRPNGATEEELNPSSLPRVLGFVAALGVGLVVTYPGVPLLIAEALNLTSHLFYIEAGIALAIGVLLTQVLVHVVRLILLRRHAGHSTALMAGAVMGLIASAVPLPYYAEAGALALDGASRFAGADLSVVTPGEITKRITEVLNN